MISVSPSLTTPSAQVQQAFQALLKREDVGFLKILQRSHLWDQSEKHADQLQTLADQFLFVGMGGSSLGAQALLKACDPPPDRFLFLENVDPSTFESVCKRIKILKRLHVILVSKSGGTIETLTLAEFLIRHFEHHGLQLSNQCTLISETKASPLTNWAKQTGIKVLEIPQDVGGRFSVLSPVGFLPLLLAGGRLSDLRTGIQWALDQERICQSLSQLTLDSFARQEWITVFWHYADQLHDAGLWWQQLWAESLAKIKTRRGLLAQRVSTPFVARGAQDQHSLLQQFSQGHRDKWFWFHTIKERPSLVHERLNQQHIESSWPLVGQSLESVFHSERQATLQALQMQGISVIDFTWDDLTPKTIAAYFMLMQMTVATLGEALDINAFDQPGVEAGKIITAEILAKRVAARPRQP